MRRALHGRWLGRRGYEPVHTLQQRLLEARQRGEAPDTVLLLEHDPVITLGRGAHGDNVLMPEELLRAAGVELVRTARGGDVTLHAPGQLVCYPIVNLAPDRRDVRRYVRNLVDTMRKLALSHGIDSGPAQGMVGLWVDKKNPSRWTGRENAAELAKLGAVGVRLSRWVTQHGFAFNLTTDLELYSMIVPCGIRDHGVTSVAELTGHRADVQEAAARALRFLAEELEADVAELEDLSGAELSRAEPRPRGVATPRGRERLSS